MWVLGTLVGFLAAGDWFLAPLGADGDKEARPSLEVGGLIITAQVRDGHVLLEAAGKDCQTIKVRLEGMEGGPMSRVVRMTALWEKDVVIDTEKGTGVDLGALPKGFSTLHASTDGKTFVPLHSSWPDLTQAIQNE